MGSFEFLIPITIFGGIFGLIYYSMKKKERRMFIERGLDLSLLESKRTASPSSLKWGMVLIGVGLGIIIGKILVAYTTFNEESAYFSMICLFGGLALVIFHFSEKDREKKNLPRTDL
jgi:hypothetical protein